MYYIRFMYVRIKIINICKTHCLNNTFLKKYKKIRVGKNIARRKSIFDLYKLSLLLFD